MVGGMSGEAAERDWALRERAELYLLHQLATGPQPPRRSSQSPPSQARRPEVERQEERLQQFQCGSVDVLRAIGILDEEAALEWRSRLKSSLESPEDPQQPVLDPAAEERARGLLEERLARVAAAPSGEDERAAMSRFDEAVRAVRVAGALSREQLEHFQSRLAERASTEGWEEFRAFRRSPLPWQGTELERVVIGPRERAAGLAITHVELHADALVVHWHRVVAIELPKGREPSRAEQARALRAAYEPRSGPVLELSDDFGTDYRSVQAQSPFRDHAESEDVVVRWGCERFRPAAPDQASELRVAFGETTFNLALSG